MYNVGLVLHSIFPENSTKIKRKSKHTPRFALLSKKRKIRKVIPICNFGLGVFTNFRIPALIQLSDERQR